MYGEERQRGTSTFLIVIVLLALVVVGGVAAWLMLRSDKTTQQNPELVIPKVQLKIQVLNSLGGQEGVNLTVVNGKFNTLVTQTRLSNNSIHNVVSLEVNTTYRLYFEGENTYPAKAQVVVGEVEPPMLTVQVDNFPSNLSSNIIQSGEDYLLNITTAESLREPIVCFKWGFDTVSILMDKPQPREIPSRLRWFDRCYQLGTWRNESRTESIKIKKILSEDVSVVIADTTTRYDYYNDTTTATVDDVAFPDVNITLVT